jgi:flavin-binding protein dodecin
VNKEAPRRKPQSFVEEISMKEKTFKLIELVGVSEASVQDAVRNAIHRAGETLKGMSWFEVTEIRGSIKGADVTEFQVTLKVGFLIINPSEMKDN